jgi:hypothetical protein
MPFREREKTFEKKFEKKFGGFKTTPLSLRC